MTNIFQSLLDLISTLPWMIIISVMIAVFILTVIFASDDDDDAGDYALGESDPTSGDMRDSTEGFDAGEPEKYDRYNGTSELSPDDIQANETIIPILYGTNRGFDRIEVDEINGSYHCNYNGRRDKLKVGAALISIPATHKMGKVDTPEWWRINKRRVAGKHICVKMCFQINTDTFRKIIAENPDKHALLFIHGFNTDFLGGLRRAAQLAYDLNSKKIEKLGDVTQLPLTSFYFSWPSSGKAHKYLADQAQVDKSEEDFLKFLKLLKFSNGIESMTIIAHSMGNRLLTRALNNISLNNQNDEIPNLGQVILAAPDVDKEQYGLWENRISKLCKGLTIYASDNDKALKLSKKASDQKRLGDSSHPISVFPNTETIDVSACGDDFLGHTPHGDSRVLSDINELVRNNTTAFSGRFWPRRKKVKQGYYWVIKDS